MHSTREDATDESITTDGPNQYVPAMPPETLVRVVQRIAERIGKHERTR